MITLRAEDLRRLNVILRLPSIDLDRTSKEKKWDVLLEDLCFSVFGVKRVPPQDAFYVAARPEGIRIAQDVLRTFLPFLQRVPDPKEPLPWLSLCEQRLYIAPRKDGFSTGYIPEVSGGDRRFATLIYSTLAHLLERSRVHPRDILTCANPQCGACFVPLRRPHAGQKNFCSSRCANLISAREYRQRKADELRAKDRRRNPARYDKKVRKETPGGHPKRRPRKTK